MRANAIALRMIAAIIGFFSIFLCVVGVGFFGLAAAQDLFEIADRMDTE